MLYVCIDPSGSFNEGKGHTGIAIMLDDRYDKIVVKSVSAKDYATRHDYWYAVMEQAFLRSTVPRDQMRVIIESYTIRANGFTIGKMPETIQFIGAMVWVLEDLGIKYTFQTPAAVKARFKDEYLPNYIDCLKHVGNRYYMNGKLTNDHIRDALKHLLYFKRYKESST